MSTTRITIEELKEILERSKPYLLRPVNESIVKDFQEAMEGGQEFPDIQVAQIQVKGAPVTFLVDGFKRSTAYLRIKSPTQWIVAKDRNYTDLGDYLADMLLANLDQGEHVSTEHRDDRIRLLCRKTEEGGYGWKQERAADKFHLTQQAISKICKKPEGTESSRTVGGKNKSRPKTKAARMQAAVERARELGGTPFLTGLASLSATLAKKEHRVGLLKFFLPKKSDPPDTRQAKTKSRNLVHAASQSLNTFCAMLENAGKKAVKGGEAA